MDFCWSPTDPTLALLVPETRGGNQPARVSLVQIPGKEELRQKNFLSVSDCKMYCQSNGVYLALKVDRHTKTKKRTYKGFELSRMKERDMPIEVLELENKNDKIIAFVWEPKGHMFAVIHGRHVVLAGLKGFNGQLEFYNVDELETMTTDIEWDSTGRYVATAMTSVREIYGLSMASFCIGY
ncbi:hypothetical protein L6164_024426 [Bauhinia variegata]|uniref:Uncharacterized protein n=1 Tax=Bauhinia variegata TaxID=167791 RepID=A0ACB9LXR4_BAUVA|nr:hypothetical protein L6164_024426 [Bauhinia variegata]